MTSIEGRLTMAKRNTPRITGAKLELHKTTIRDLTIRSGVKTGISASCGGCYSELCETMKICPK